MIVRSTTKKRTGWVIPKCTLLRYMKKKDVIDQCLEPTPYWDDWKDWRDGHRGYRDRTKISSGETCCGFGLYKNKSIKKRIKKKLKIREAKKESQRIRSLPRQSHELVFPTLLSRL